MEVSYLGVLVAAIATMIIGMIWYAPAVFGKAWMSFNGFSEKKMKSMQKGMGKSILLGMITYIIVAYVLAVLMLMTGSVGTSAAITLALWVWFGFFFTANMGIVLWENKPWGLYIIHAGFWLVTLVVNAAILAVL